MPGFRNLGQGMANIYHPKTTGISTERRSCLVFWYAWHNFLPDYHFGSWNCPPLDLDGLGWGEIDTNKTILQVALQNVIEEPERILGFE